MIRANAYTDRYQRDNRTLLLFQHRLIEIGPLADFIVQATSDDISMPDLVTRVTAEFGEPADGSAESIVESCVQDLAAHDVVCQLEPSET
ncbi:MAG: hypothetical protein ACK5LN_11110 [Propioniciclava sp.]